MPSLPSRLPASPSHSLSTSYLAPDHFPSMFDIRSVRSTANSLMTNTSPRQFLARDPNSLSIEEILSSSTSEARINAVRMELEEAVSTRVEEDQVCFTASYLQYLASMNIDEILQFTPPDNDMAAVISELTGAPLPRNRASRSRRSHVSQERGALAASGAAGGASSRLPSRSNASRSLSFYDTLLPVSNENKLMYLTAILNWNEEIFFIFNFNFDLQVQSRKMKVRKVSFHAEDQIYIYTPPFILYKKCNTLHLSILKKNLPPDGRYIVSIVYSVNSLSRIARTVERKDRTLISSFLLLKADIKITHYYQSGRCNLNSKVKDCSGQNKD